MEQTELKFSLYTPENPLLHEVRVKEILVPSARGQLGIRPGHTGIISLLEAGILKYLPTDSNEWRNVAVGWGYLEVYNGEVRVLAETVRTKEALERAATEKTLEEVEDSLKQEDLEPKIRQKLERERLRLQAELDL